MYLSNPSRTGAVTQTVSSNGFFDHDFGKRSCRFPIFINDIFGITIVEGTQNFPIELEGVMDQAPAFCATSGGRFRIYDESVLKFKGENMTTNSIPVEQEPKKTKVVYRGRTSDAVYGLGFIGAAIYFIGQAATFWLGVLGFLKALVWPVFLVYAAMKSLGM